MKTTLNLHGALLTKAKALAARQHLSLTRLIEEGLRLRLRSADAGTVQVHRPMPVAGQPHPGCLAEKARPQAQPCVLPSP